MSVTFTKSANNSVYAKIGNRILLLKDPHLNVDTATDNFSLKVDGEGIGFLLSDIDKANCSPVLVGTTSATLFAEIVDNFFLDNLKYVSTTVMPTPASITPTGGSGQISVAFGASAGSTNFLVQASSDNFATIAGNYVGTATPIVADGLTNGTAYKTRVRGEAPGAIPSNWKTTASGTTPA